MAQTKGTFETHDFDNFRLHVYHTNDALGDASYIVEGTQAVVTLEQPLFRENVAEYDAYLDALGKPVEARIADYHVGGTGDHATVMPEGMPAFTKDAVYDGMMRNFAQTFGDAIVDRPTGATDEVAFGTTQRGFRSVSTAAPRPTFPPRASSSAARSATPTGLPRRHTRIPCKSPRRQPSTPRSPRPVGRSHRAPSSSSADTAERPGPMPCASRSTIWNA